jgi:hypothetical protein
LTSPPFTRPAGPRRRALALAALLLAAGPVAGCSKSTADGCYGVSERICDRLAECNSLDTVFASENECALSFNGLFEVEGSDEAACRQTWTDVKALECAEFLDYFKI